MSYIRICLAPTYGHLYKFGDFCHKCTMCPNMDPRALSTLHTKPVSPVALFLMFTLGSLFIHSSPPNPPPPPPPPPLSILRLCNHIAEGKRQNKVAHKNIKYPPSIQGTHNLLSAQQIFQPTWVMWSGFSTM